jgi:phosphoenolpyruvate---glycerone phosphotransferase subunit DhaL
MGALRLDMERVLLVDVTTLRAWIGEIDRTIEEHRDHLTHLDSAIGDADHGINLVRGFSAAVSAVEELDPQTPGHLLMTVGATLISKVGGASGPLYGTAFRRAGKAIGADPDVSPESLGAALEAALDGVRGLGAANEGDKTMVDALAPAVRAYQQATASGASQAEAVQAAAEAAEAGAVATIPLQALKGRASYLGPRSVGHQDPGATSTALILRALATTVSRTP